MSQIETRFETVYYDQVVPLNQLKSVADLYAVNIVDASHKVRNGNWTWEEGRRSVEDARAEIDTLWAAYRTTNPTAEERQRMRLPGYACPNGHLAGSRCSHRGARSQLPERPGVPGHVGAPSHERSSELIPRLHSVDTLHQLSSGAAVKRGNRRKSARDQQPSYTDHAIPRR